ncbi:MULTISPECIES: monovalent cation/H(+) antiporter subunit G [unclassified Wenzhouxiangella]|uniref:cation:proton antiporter n=1 Tax=unclassified Wenzhouxiangella TaxID=2613841 RepID=UPI000E325F67|nr:MULTISPECIES: monovalent cation/H(+) antiporter subunit G [unclassified Wenzhouxiangella]RFF28057.1 monovalent cation/H(+) antiporter subunit G [Wenzhouxiangella sp. 15181]RFP68643.1 monovalent cation/H(+) antiporter subunit G [Wenzhouxiangella sp. 15190]
MSTWLAIALILIGCSFFLAGTVGLLRFPDTHSRLHALTKADNLGLGFICAGLAVHDGSLTGTIHLLFVWALAMMAATVSAFLIARWADEEPEH